MARVKLSEYQAKKLLLSSLDQSYQGFAATSATTEAELKSHFPADNLVVKVDQGIKKRGKLGLVRVNCTPAEARVAIQSWSKEGWSQFLVEPVIEHAEDAERYLALERVRTGWQCSWGEKGGVEVESAWSQVKTKILGNDQTVEGVDISRLIKMLETSHIVFLECNPVLLRQKKVIPLDMAAEIDNTALAFPELMSQSLIPVEERNQSVAEKAVAELDKGTPASLKFRVLNPNGAIWMLLSGGGASLVLADEVADQGMGRELANYGEYSGAPSDQDVYRYAQIVLKALLDSQAPRKALIIAGGVANFTDVAKTFKGLIMALEENKAALKKAQVEVFVRRGGPNEVQGLKNMEKFLKQADLFGAVHNHTIDLTKVVSEARDYL